MERFKVMRSFGVGVTFSVGVGVAVSSDSSVTSGVMVASGLSVTSGVAVTSGSSVISGVTVGSGVAVGFDGVTVGSGVAVGSDGVTVGSGVGVSGSGVGVSGSGVGVSGSGAGVSGVSLPSEITSPLPSPKSLAVSICSSAAMTDIGLDKTIADKIVTHKLLVRYLFFILVKIAPFCLRTHLYSFKICFLILTYSHNNCRNFIIPVFKNQPPEKFPDGISYFFHILLTLLQSHILPSDLSCKAGKAPEIPDNRR